MADPGNDLKEGDPLGRPIKNNPPTAVTKVLTQYTDPIPRLGTPINTPATTGPITRFKFIEIWERTTPLPNFSGPTNSAVNAIRAGKRPLKPAD